MSTTYLKNALSPLTQLEALAGQVQNNAGGFVYAVDDFTRLDRFLVLGSEGGSYYATEQKLTRENAAVVTKLAGDIATGVKLVNRIVEISVAGRAPKNDPAILALAIAARSPHELVRKAAYAALPKVCRIGTHLYHFVQFSTQLGGWGRGLRTAVAKWFNAKPADTLALQLIKYQSRDGWSSRDLLRLSHPKPPTPEHALLYKWATSGEFDLGDTLALETDALDIVGAFEAIKKTDLTREALDLIATYKLPRECVPTELLNKPEIWEALLPHMGLTALIRNLGTMTKIGLVAPLSSASKLVVERLNDGDALRKSRVHPLVVLVAHNVYAAGRGVKGSSTWSPVQPVVDALDRAFYAAFGNVKPTGKTTLLALDVSASMTWKEIAGMPGITPRVGSAAMSLVTAAVEPNAHIVGFSNGLRDIPISSKMRMADVIQTIERIPASSTDCSLPFIWAMGQLGRGIKVESFAVYTDSETFAGRIHPSVALKEYRKKSGVDARSAVIGMVANNFTIADPADAGMLDVVGFDSATPAILSSFFSGSNVDVDSCDDGEAQ